MNAQEEILIGGPDSAGRQAREVQQRLRQRSSEAARMADDLAGNKRSLRIVIVDDQDLVRNGFRLILSSYENIVVVGEAGDGRQAVARARELKPDVVLMDIRMPVENGIEATREITADPALIDTRVLILTTFDIDEYVYDALAAGASGFMLKDSEPDEIVYAIETVAAGDALIEPSITRRLVETFVKSRPSQNLPLGSLSALTEREREILALVARGLTNHEIAQSLVISPATVKTHAARIMSKLGAHDRAQLVVLAYENGLVIPGI
ncbi:MAG: response regulator transcription factor [Raoultibacter sp.]